MEIWEQILYSGGLSHFEHKSLGFCNRRLVIREVKQADTIKTLNRMF